MLEGLNELVGLSQLDSKLAVLEKERGEIPARRAAAEAEQRASEARLVEARETVSEAEQAQRRSEAHAQDKEVLLARLEGQQHQIKTNTAYTALLAEMEQAREAISEAETGVLEAMEAIETARAELSAREERARRVSERHETEEKARGAREEALEAEIAVLRTARSAQAAGLDRALLVLYEKVASRRSPAVAVITGELCLGCRVGIPPQAFIEIRKAEKVVTCSHCQRILIHRDRLAAS